MRKLIALFAVFAMAVGVAACKPDTRPNNCNNGEVCDHTKGG